MLPESFTPGFLRQLEILRVRARRAFLGTKQGGHVSLRKGHGIEFSDFRKYELGDNPRHIDWGVFARSDRLFVKRFQEEEDLSVLIIVDGSASMVAIPEDQKWERARDMGLALSYMALMEQDSLLFTIPGALEISSYAGAKSVHTLGKRAIEAKPGGDPLMPKEMQRIAARIRFPGKAIVISDFMMEIETLEAMFQPLRSKNLDITAIQVLGPHDIEPFDGLKSTTIKDSETGEVVTVSLDPENRAAYSELLDEHNRRFEEFMHGAQIQFARMRTDEDLLSFLVNNLTSIGLLRRS